MLGNTIQHFADNLSVYFDFDFLDRLSIRRKQYHTYLANIKKEQTISMPDHTSVILKELSPEQLSIYNIIAKNWNPHLETIYGILTDSKNPQYSLSVNEFIPRPTSLPYAALPANRSIKTRFLTLEQYIQSFGCLSEKDALIFLDQLCDALSTLHENHLIHGDISPKNILLTDALPIEASFSKVPGIHQHISVKLIDFDISRTFQFTNHTVTHAVGTLPYAAPDVINFKTATDRLDIYSLGCIFFFMLTGKSPKEGNVSGLLRNYSKAVRKIFSNCTANYEIRYRNVKQLRKDIKYYFIYPDTRFFHFLQKIPGFRTGSPTKMLIATETYSLFIPYCLSDLQHNQFFICLLLVPFIVGFDVFHIGELFPRYQQLCRILPAIQYVISFVIINIILLILNLFFPT